MSVSELHYAIPNTMEQQLKDFGQVISSVESGILSEQEFKPYRTLFGIYEQRQKQSYMIRIRCPAGIITASQLRAVTNIQQRNPEISVHISTRQQLQLHTVSLHKILQILYELYTVNLCSWGGGGNAVRNITASWDSGIACDEVFDVTPYVLSLTSMFLSEPDSFLLPRKLKIAFSNSLKDTAHAMVHDIGFIATIKDTIKGFAVYVGGGLGKQPQAATLFIDFIKDFEVLAVAAALKKVFYLYGDRQNRNTARIRFLFNSIGMQKFRELFEQQYALIQPDYGKAFPFNAIENNQPQSNYLVSECTISHGFSIWKDRFVQKQQQADLFSIKIPVAQGDLTSDQMTAIADITSILGENTIRLTQTQNISLRNVHSQYLEHCYNKLSSVFPLANKNRFFYNTIACTGSSLCQLGICDSKKLLTAIIQYFTNKHDLLNTLPDLKINISGCSNSCGNHLIADIGLCGKKIQYNGQMVHYYTFFTANTAVIGSFQLGKPFCEIQEESIPLFLSELLQLYVENTKGTVSLVEFISTIKDSSLHELVEHFSGTVL